jgi:cbb3-type cytochrome oxidase subunit 1
MKKGVNLRLGTGVILFFYFDCIIFIQLIIGINIIEQSRFCALCLGIIGVVVSLLLGFEMSRNYAEADNYDRYFIIVLISEGILFMVLALLTHNKFYPELQ